MALDFSPVSGHAVEILIDELYTTSEEVIAKTRRIMGAEKKFVIAAIILIPHVFLSRRDV
jgi:hypothetical protein